MVAQSPVRAWHPPEDTSYRSCWGGPLRPSSKALQKRWLRSPRLRSRLRDCGNIVAILCQCWRSRHPGFWSICVSQHTNEGRKILLTTQSANMSSRSLSMIKLDQVSRCEGMPQCTLRVVLEPRCADDNMLAKVNGLFWRHRAADSDVLPTNTI